jgi:glycerol-3-phosphate dehydrogenase (NAD(P)+)
MKNILVLGFGVASTAYITLLQKNKNQVSVVGTPFDLEKINLIKKNKIIKNSNLNIKFSNNVSFFKQFEDLNNIKYSLIIIGVNSNGLTWAVEQLNKIKNTCTVLILTKGLLKEKNKIYTISDYVKIKTKFKNIVYAAGPCLANELINQVHTRTVLASGLISDAKYVKSILENEYYHPDITNDIRSAEICAATKNIYATIIGSASGQSSNRKVHKLNKNYFNAASALFEQSLKEMSIIVKKYRGSIKTVLGPAGSGDLYVSALGGRNSKLGFYLGKGFLYKHIIKKQMKGITVEGAELILDVGSLLLKSIGTKKLPLALFLFNAVSKNKKLHINWKKFIN